jgi:hypothetical protein
MTQTPPAARRPRPGASSLTAHTEVTPMETWVMVEVAKWKQLSAQADLDYKEALDKFTESKRCLDRAREASERLKTIVSFMEKQIETVREEAP